MAPILQQIIDHPLPKVGQQSCLHLFHSDGMTPATSLPAGTTLIQAFNQLGPKITSDTDTI